MRNKTIYALEPLEQVQFIHSYTVYKLLRKVTFDRGRPFIIKLIDVVDIWKQLSSLSATLAMRVSFIYALLNFIGDFSCRSPFESILAPRGVAPQKELPQMEQLLALMGLRKVQMPQFFSSDCGASQTLGFSSGMTTGSGALKRSSYAIFSSSLFQVI